MEENYNTHPATQLQTPSNMHPVSCVGKLKHHMVYCSFVALENSYHEQNYI